MLCEKGVLKNFTKLTGKHLCQSLNPFQINVTFLYPPEKSENQKLTDVFKEFRNGTLT